MNDNPRKWVIGSLYVSREIAEAILERSYINEMSQWERKNFDRWKGRSDVAYSWDLINDDIIVLVNTIVTPEDDLARECMLMPDNGVRLAYLNNLD